MPSITSYKDTKAADYLDAIRKHLAESQNANTSSENFTPTFIKPFNNQINFSNSFTNTEKTIGDYELGDYTAYQIFLPFNYSITDHTYNGNDGTVSAGTEQYTDYLGVSGTGNETQGFDFDGSTYITLANESNFDYEYTGDFAISFWIRPDSAITGTTAVIAKRAALTSSDVGWSVSYDATNQRLIFELCDGTTAFVVNSTNSSILKGKLYQVVCNYDGSSNQSGLTIYIDGSLDATGASSAISTTILNNLQVTIGSDDGGGNKFTGMLKDVYVFDEDIAAANITRLSQGKQINLNTLVTPPAFLGFSDTVA